MKEREWPACVQAFAGARAEVRRVGGSVEKEF